MNNTQNTQISVDQKAFHALETIRAFREIIEQETTALTEHDFRTATKLHETKKELSQQYADVIETLSDDIEKLQSLPPEIKERFKKERSLFGMAVSANKTALEKAGTIASRLSKHIISAARNALSTNGVNYTAYGTSKQAASRPLHMQINETL